MGPEELLECQEMVDDCLDREQKLSQWESDFMTTLDDQLADRGFISDKQYSILSRVWDRVTARG